MKTKYRVITFLLAAASVMVATRFLLGRMDLDRIKEKSGQVTGTSIREKLRPLKTKHDKLSQEEKKQLSRMIRQDEPGPKHLEEIKNEYKKLPEQERKFLNYMVKVYPEA